LGVTFKTLGL